MTSQEAIEDSLRRRVPIVLAIPKWVGVKHAPDGKSERGRCPFCGKLQFGLNVKAQTWFCRNCLANGDVIDFYVKMDGLSRERAVKALLLKCVADKIE